MKTSESTDAAASAAASARTGVLYGLGAYLTWGLVPLYWKTVTHLPGLELLAHRIAWSVVVLVVLRWARGEGRAAWLPRDRRTILTLLGSTTLIAGNWFMFIYAVASNNVLQASLGYFINPLVNVLLGFVFLRERLRRWQTFSVVLATVAVTYLTVTYGRLPWIALTLAMSFGFYGLLRKVARVEAVSGLLFETTALFPFAIGLLGYLAWAGRGAFGATTWTTSALLAAAGLVTAIPLIWFVNAARRLRMATLGFLQYLAPSGQFLLAVILYGEPFTRTHLVSFTLIWTALLIYSTDAALWSRSARLHKPS